MRTLLLLASLLACQAIAAQRKFPFEHHVQMEGSVQTLKEFENRPMILELFSSTCIVCFKQLPKFQELYERYHKQLNFLLLGDDTIRLPKLFAVFKKKLDLGFPAAFDPALFHWLDPGFVPRYYWINQKGIISAITGPAEVTAANIELFLQEQFSFEEQPKKTTVNLSTLLPDTNFTYRSLFTGANENWKTLMPPRLGWAGEGPWFEAINVSLRELYQYAFIGKYYLRYGDSLYGHILPDPVIDTMANIDLSEKVCFSIAFPAKRSLQALQRALKNELENKTGVQTTLEIRTLPYYALVRTDSASFPRSVHVKKLLGSSYAGIDFKAALPADLLKLVDYNCRTKLPYVDETGINYPIDLHFEAMMTQLDDIKKALEGIGLSLIVRHRPMQVMVMRRLP